MSVDEERTVDLLGCGEEEVLLDPALACVSCLNTEPYYRAAYDWLGTPAHLKVWNSLQLSDFWSMRRFGGEFHTLRNFPTFLSQGRYNDKQNRGVIRRCNVFWEQS